MTYRFIQALRRQPVDCTPVWIMRQAGRYLPEYRALREKVPDFMTLCKSPELACEVTLQPLKRFALDAAIIFSDILTIPDAMGLGVTFLAGEGPNIASPVRTAKDAEKLRVIEPEEETAYVMDAIKLVHNELHGKTPIIGFAGSPWTIATYMIEGGSSKSFYHTKSMLYQDTRTLEVILEKLTQSIILYLRAQIDAGASAIMIFDTWGGALPAHLYSKYSCRYMEQIIHGLPRFHLGQPIPVICFSKGVALSSMDLLADSGCDAVGLDWTVPLCEAKAKFGHKVALQGNLDPGVLYGTEKTIESEVQRLLQEVGRGGHVFNLGHGITPEVNPEMLNVLVNSVHEYSKAII